MELIQSTIGGCLKSRARETPLHIGMSYGDVWYSWREIDEITDFLAVLYHKRRIVYKSHVAIWSVNTPAWVFCFFALVKIGAIPVMVNTCYKAVEVESLLRRMDVEVLFYGDGVKEIDFSRLLNEVSMENLPKLRMRIPLDGGQSDTWPSRKNFPRTMPGVDAKILREITKKVTPYDTACILPTSGTTNRPKGVMLSHLSLINNSAEVARQMKWRKEDKFCISVPLFHCFGISTGILAALYCGASLHLLKFYKTLDVLKEIEIQRCTVLNGVPTMFLSLAKSGKRPLYDLSSIKSGIIAGSPVTPTEYNIICCSLNMSHLQTSYGQTESSPCISISDYEDLILCKAQNSGKIIPGIEVMIWNNETFKRADTGVQGEILTRGYHVMQGYYQMKEETLKAIDKDGWLHTGDLGCLDKNGYLKVTGRMKDIIIRGGENISPVEIEECILQLDCVDAVKIVGIQADVLQEEIAACIIPKPGWEIEEEKIKTHVSAQLANYKVPKYILKMDEFPTGTGGKLQTGELKRRVYAWIETKKR